MKKNMNYLGELRKKDEEIKTVLKLVDKQADDEKLWFSPKYITEDNLQRALRNLHSAVEKLREVK